MKSTKSTKSGNYFIPGAILLAGLLIAGALFYGGGDGGTVAQGSHNGLPNNGGGLDIRPVGAEDHILGNPEATVAVIEFSDFECPFCARLHPTLSRIVEENDDVQWVYRHFPLSSIHSEAQRAAVASECAAQLGGNDAFWEFADALFTNQKNLGDSLYTDEAVRLGLNQDSFTQCLNDKSISSEVTTDYNEAVSAGGRGTPFSVLVTASGEMVPFSGALPYEQINTLIEQARVN